jgi:hypothetical protein
MPAFGGVVDAEVIEDRGDLGQGGEQIVRLRYRITAAEEDLESEMPVSWLVAPPTEPLIEQFRRRDALERAARRNVARRARRAATV